MDRVPEGKKKRELRSPLFFKGNKTGSLPFFDQSDFHVSTSSRLKKVYFTTSHDTDSTSCTAMRIYSFQQRRKAHFFVLFAQLTRTYSLQNDGDASRRQSNDGWPTVEE
ncbi:hypothetical protein RUM43_001438 [Polyplax serrata]|uniref:Uncharacterized protein n=1 Tax=Polyplax serrata TaxID=468196 RepID=A0AAN8XTX3_POLSC